MRNLHKVLDMHKIMQILMHSYEIALALLSLVIM